MDWKQKYASKIMSVDEAMRHIRPGENIIPGDFCAEPEFLLQGLVRNIDEIGEVRVTHGGNVGSEPHLAPEMKDRIHFNCLCAVPISARAIEERRADYVPCYFHQWPKLIGKGGPQQCDVAFLQVSEPDENGMCSLGVSADFTCYLADIARLTIAQVNKNVPWMDDNTISIDKLDCLALHDEPLVELKDSFAGPKEEAIAQYVLPLIEDGACLQIGRGKLPDYVMGKLMDRKHLGIHSEMISDGVMKLMESGAVDNSLKNVMPGKTVCSMLAGSAELYKWANRNPDIALMPVDFTNDPFVIAQNDNVVSLNSAIEVDLLGQAVCDMIGPRQFTGVGGFTDFVRGAQRSKGGKTILAFSATGKGGISRIVPHVTYGAAVAGTRWDTDYVVTEYGMAQLWGKSNRERVEQLINIAAPEHREALRKDAIERNLLW